MWSRSVWFRSVVLAAVVPALLAGCGGDEPPRVKNSDRGPDCRSEGTVNAQPVATIDDAIAPYREPGHRKRISEKHSGTATVLLTAKPSGPAPVSVTLVQTLEGWAVTSVQRC
jgi:hypothetical protein